MIVAGSAVFKSDPAAAIQELRRCYVVFERLFVHDVNESFHHVDNYYM